jgi:3-isopropylmalate dehydrogenase
MFEPIGGSAPKYTGKNVINPLAAIFAAGMMLEYLGEGEAALAIDEAAARALRTDVKSVDAGKMGMGTKELGDLIVRYLG